MQRTVLDYATSNGLVIVSHDESTLKPLAEDRIRTGRGISGLFIAPQNRPPRMIAESLVLVWPRFAMWDEAAMTKPQVAERLRSLAGPVARNGMSRKTVMPARSSATSWFGHARSGFEPRLINRCK